MKYVGMMTLYLLGNVITTILSGYVFSLIWKWFVVHQFGLPNLSIPISIGICYIIQYATSTYNENRFKDDIEFSTKLGTMFLYGLLKPIIVLIFASIVKLFI